MKIGGFQKFSTVDYPGHLCCTVFLIGCNMRCKFCHNPVLMDKTGIEEVPLEEVLSFLEKRKGLLQGVCITGGEPTLHDDLEEFIILVKNMGYKVKLDTNGTKPQVIKNLITKGLIDYVAVDIKAPLEKYPDITGYVNISEIKETIRIVLNSNIDYEFRTTFLPDFYEEDIIEIAKSIEGSKCYILQQFRNNITLDKKYANKKPHEPAYIFSVADNIKRMFNTCEVRGV